MLLLVGVMCNLLCHHPAPSQVRAQVTDGQLSGVEVAQREAVLQRQLEEAWVLRLHSVQHGLAASQNLRHIETWCTVTQSM
jgi:hypothetical protein